METDVKDKETAPSWEKIPGEMVYRGTIDDLTNNLLEVALIDKELLSF